MMRPHQILLLIALWGVGFHVGPVRAAKNDWAEGTPGENNGASRDYYNRAGSLKWTNFMGDWRDRDDKPQGQASYAKAKIPGDAKQFIEWDVTSLVKEWRTGQFPNQGFFLRSLEGRAVFCSREHPETKQRPELVLVGAEKTLTLPAEADTLRSAPVHRQRGSRQEIHRAGFHRPVIRGLSFLSFIL